MTVRLSIIIFLLMPFVLFGQADSNNINEGLSKDIYSIMKTLIKKEKLNKKYGLALNPGKSFNIDQEDSAYLQTLLIKPKPVDTISSNDSVILINLSYPDKNIFTQADIKYILETKHNLESFKWDNKQLGFNLKNEKNFYTFSIPYFNLAHDKVIVMYEFLCPGLYGGGATILLNKTTKGWDNTTLQRWVH